MQCKIGFSTSDSWISKTIRDATRAKVSHAYIVFDGLADVEHEVYEAAWCGFRMGTRAHVGRIVEEIAIDCDARAALTVCRAWLETPYDYLGLVGEAPVQLGRLFGRRWPNVLGGAHHMFCSEAATYLLQFVQLPSAQKSAVLKLDPRATSPADLLWVLHAF